MGPELTYIPPQSYPSHYTGLSCMDSEDVNSLQLRLHQLLSTSKHLDLANPITLIPWMLLSLSKQGKSKPLEMQIRFCFWLLLRTLPWDPSDETIFFSTVQALHGLVPSHFSCFPHSYSVLQPSPLSSWSPSFPFLPSPRYASGHHYTFGKVSQVISNRPDLLVYSPMESNTYSSSSSPWFIAKKS